MDSGAATPPAIAVMIDATLLGLFAVQHSVMARPAFKRGWTQFVPAVIERSTYVLLASLILALLFWQWRPLPHLLWSLQPLALRALVWAAFWIGWATVLLSTFLINHFDFFGLRQVWAYRARQETPPADFQTPLFYKIVRHPLYLGFMLAFWAAPTMTVGRLMFAATTTLYSLIAIQLEEQDLRAIVGDRYDDYRERGPMILPFPKGRRSAAKASEA